MTFSGQQETVMSIKLASYSYSDSNSSNDFAQNQYADSSWHAEFKNGNHFFPRSNRLTLRGQNTAYPIKFLFMDRFEKFDHKCVRLIKKQ